LKSLGLAEIYLEDGAPVTALQLIREALDFPALRSADVLKTHCFRGADFQDTSKSGLRC